MKRILLDISYDGTAYSGWQVQPNAITVQQVLQDSLYKLLGKEIAVTGCSRTDAGVHARQFCCHIDCDDSLPESTFLRGLNSYLPNDIAVNGCKEVTSDFHARYDAKGKTYCYTIWNTSKKSAFKSRYTWQIERPLDIEKMNIFCKQIIGTHDFYAFSSSGRTVENTVRTISECFVEKHGDEVILSVTGDGFLYNMARIIVGTAVSVSDGKIDPLSIEEILKSKKRELAGMTAPAKGLFLERVYY